MDEKRKQFYKKVEEQYREHSDRLIKMYARFLSHRERAEDIIQEAYTRALTYWDAYDEEKPFDKWFNSIISSCLRDNKRIERMHGMVDISEALDVPVKPAAIPAIILNQVMKRINEKNDTTKSILKLTFLKHFRPGEIAETVQMTPNAIRKIVWKFREEIRRDFRWSL